MKLFLGFFVFITLCSFGDIDDIYSITLKSIDGKKIDLSIYRGKKILFIVCPLSSSDTALSLTELASIQKRYDSSLQIIGIVAEEAGFNKKNINSLKNLYKGQKSNFILTTGMKVKKTAGAEQSSLLRWLTDRTKNKHFDLDVEGVGQKFFVDEQGELYAVLGPKLKLSSPFIDRALNRQKPKKKVDQRKH